MVWPLTLVGYVLLRVFESLAERIRKPSQLPFIADGDIAGRGNMVLTCHPSQWSTRGSCLDAQIFTVGLLGPLSYPPVKPWYRLKRSSSVDFPVSPYQHQRHSMKRSGIGTHRGRSFLTRCCNVGGERGEWLAS